MRVSKDVLGIIILKLSYRDVLNLRATSKDLRDVIATFNKFWFLKYFKRWAKFNQFDRYLCTHINLEHYSKSIDEKYLEQTNINVINDLLILYYCFEFSYFDLLVTFKPKHARCSYCKTMYPDDSTFYIIDNLGVNRNILNYYWRNLEKPKYLKILEHLCNYCVRDFVHQGLFQ